MARPEPGIVSFCPGIRYERVSPLSRFSWETVIPFRRAISHNVSPRFTTYFQDSGVAGFSSAVVAGFSSDSVLTATTEA